MMLHIISPCSTQMGRMWNVQEQNPLTCPTNLNGAFQKWRTARLQANNVDIDDIFDMYAKIWLNSPPPETMIIAYPEGTWLLRLGEEPVLLGEESDFDSIMLKALH